LPPRRGEVLDLDAVIAGLSEYSDPQAFLHMLDPVAGIPNETFFGDPAYKPLREAWAAGRFAKALSLRGRRIEVKLAGADERFPDFYVKCDSKERLFEFTEAMEPSRQRHREYKEATARPFWSDSLGRIDGQKAVAAAIQKKLDRHYSGRPHLLVYANFSGDEIDLAECLASCGDACAGFSSVWILRTIWVAKLADQESFPEPALTPLPFESASHVID
jgi:hypothetical protein